MVSMSVREAIKNDYVKYRDLYYVLRDKNIGCWDQINDTDTITDYICEMVKKGIHVSHIVEALEQNDSEYDDWRIWLGNSMETPEPINSKQDLINALEPLEEELETIIEIEVEEDE